MPKAPPQGRISANVIAGKLGPAFTKSIVLRKLHQLEEERLARAKVIAARKAAKASGLKRASKAIDAPRKVTRGQSPVVQLVNAAPIRFVASTPLRPKPATLQGITLLTCARGTADGHSATIDLLGCSAALRRLVRPRGASTISASPSQVFALRSSMDEGAAPE